MSPYIVTTTERETCPDCDGNPWSQRLGSGESGCAACSNRGTYAVPVSRRAVFTQEGVRESEGDVVEEIGWFDLAEQVRGERLVPASKTEQAALIDAFNARQS